MEKVYLEPLHPEKRVILNIINEYFIDNRMGYIKVPTGWEKTFLAKHIMNKYYENGKIILFLASRNNQLLNQTFYRDESKPLFPYSLILSSEHGRISAEDLESTISGRDGGIVIFASLQTILSKINREIKDILIQNSDLVIIDEIHNFIHNRGNVFIDEISKNAKVLGMTATPFQGVIGNVKFVDDISGDMREIYSKTLPQCIIDGQLSELSYTIIRSNQNILNIFDFEKGLSELDKDELYLDCGTSEKIELTVQRTYLAKKVYDKKIESKKRKTLVFCAPVRNIVYGLEDEKRLNTFHAKLCSAIFNGEIKDTFDPSISFNNYSNPGQFKDAVYLSSELPKKEQNAILEAFRTPDKAPFVLCTVGMLVEGFNFPDLENLILLRPTLSMRLFEQQVGRVTRLPRHSKKEHGNIFEIVDDIDSLYDNFGEAVFKEKKIERIQMLQPENRSEELFTEGNTTEAITSGKIQISEINFKDIVEKFQEESVQIPPTSLRAKYFYKLLSMVEKKTDGALAAEKEGLMKMAMGFKIHSIDDAREISKLIMLLDRLEQDALVDSKLSVNCSKHKPQVFNEVKWLLKLRVLTHLKFNSDLMPNDKIEALKILGFGEDLNKIDDYRIECLKNGLGCDLNNLLSHMLTLNNLSSYNLINKKRIIDRWIRERVSWASFFTTDHPEFRELLESKQWNYNVRRYIISK